MELATIFRNGLDHRSEASSAGRSTPWPPEVSTQIISGGWSSRILQGGKLPYNVA
jgi:hypothetical protein